MVKIIDTDNLNNARKQIDKAAKNKQQAIVQGRDIEFNRKILEMKKVNILVLNHKIGKDKLKERDSGLNQVLTKIAKENNITLAIDFSELQEQDKKKKAKIMSRMIQNIKLIKKYKNNLIILNKPDDRLSLSALLRVLGADTKLASQASRN